MHSQFLNAMPEIFEHVLNNTIINSIHNHPSMFGRNRPGTTQYIDLN
jgi:hypothetical protein